MAENSPKRRKIAALGEIPNHEDHVFLPISDLPDLTHHIVSFLRASPAVGKSTLGCHLAAVSGSRSRYTYTYCQLCPTESVEDTLLHAVRSTVQLINPTLSQALKERQKRPDHVLVIDEAHLLFGQPLCETVLKSGAKLLLLSASAEGSRSTQVTPAEVSQRLLWKPQLEVTEDVVKDFQEAGLNVHLDVLKLLANICAHIKGVFMYAIHFFYVNDRDCSDLGAAISQIKRHQNDFDRQLQSSRAVKINGGFDVTSNEEFIKVLLTGPTKNMKSEVLRDLCIKGALLPV
eukprot:CAMPEP_0206443254 /NCGR_PEP_ID=MMETSP0324_2-20121206/14266_1 /ASSEMBLY_ACC=CAM_ASM_000836 /TAXON_ID=2866 /ORGANISM="Crypthecodinium cohnii, Strain Seligo" /LENGTH=288 /DNA_ID=CAMNT_0053911169 /DNA_START=51 /DNA_END=914 /DNA_ORIENTATION=-